VEITGQVELPVFQVGGQLEKNTSDCFVAHAPATLEQIQQTEAVLGMRLPPGYRRLLVCTNGLGLSLDELSFICGAGNARAPWHEILSFQKLTFPRYEYHEVSTYWLQWQDVLEYERERQTGITTFLSDERVCVPFAHTIDEWCFDRSQPDEQGEYPILFWDHELREATREDADFEAWFRGEVLNEQMSS
jgi:hypothetical protein